VIVDFVADILAGIVLLVADNVETVADIVDYFAGVIVSAAVSFGSKL
jgi:hypothetical protein